MDVLVLIDKLDDLVHQAKAVPLTDQVRIDREEIWEILDQMRASIPEEIKQARWIVKERQEMLGEAKREAERIIQEAREIAQREASQQEIVRLAERQAQQYPRIGPAARARGAARRRGLRRPDPVHARDEPRQVPRPCSAAASSSPRAVDRQPSGPTGAFQGRLDRVSAPRYRGAPCSTCDRIRLAAGEQHRQELPVTIPPFTVGGEAYVAEPGPCSTRPSPSRACATAGCSTSSFPARCTAAATAASSEAVLDLDIAAQRVPRLPTASWPGRGRDLRVPAATTSSTPTAWRPMR